MFDVSLMVAVPVVVGSLGVVLESLTDRYGGRLVFPVISALTILPVLFIGFFALIPSTLLLLAGFFLGRRRHRLRRLRPVRPCMVPTRPARSVYRHFGRDRPVAPAHRPLLRAARCRRPADQTGHKIEMSYIGE
ncbi:hypothetical protein [Janibacter alittae]|uniref:ABC transmembrane type-1 domain-containing protein n=1 Tax=Janibacter alittae TaxID=3115209 RepID=A0ABZ2MLW5_9MICO